MSSKKIWAIISILILLMGGVFIYVILSAPKAMAPQQTDQPPTTSTPKPDASKNNNKGKYVAYNKAEFEATSGRRLLFFHAAWCPQCRALEQSITNGEVPKGVTIFKVNYDTESMLKQRYVVTIQTTVVEVDAEANLARKFVAYDDPSLAALIKEFGK